MADNFIYKALESLTLTTSSSDTPPPSPDHPTKNSSLSSMGSSDTNVGSSDSSNDIDDEFRWFMMKDYQPLTDASSYQPLPLTAASSYQPLINESETESGGSSENDFFFDFSSDHSSPTSSETGLPSMHIIIFYVSSSAAIVSPLVFTDSSKSVPSGLHRAPPQSPSSVNAR